MAVPELMRCVRYSTGWIAWFQNTFASVRAGGTAVCFPFSRFKGARYIAGELMSAYKCVRYLQRNGNIRLTPLQDFYAGIDPLKLSCHDRALLRQLIT